MVVASTCLAPFYAFVSEHAQILKSTDKRIGQMLLFFGCRHPDADYTYRSELEQLEKELDGRSRLDNAFRRVKGEKGKGRVYIQNRIEERVDEVMVLLREGAGFYVCGRARMVGKARRKFCEQYERGHGGDEVKWWSKGLKSFGKW